MRQLIIAVLVPVVFTFGCTSDDDGGIPDLPDDDGDGIANVHEGKPDLTDTDGDGEPDYLDGDSDGDGISDAQEAGDDLSGTPPIDSDGDGAPDFRDLDADDNGLPDGQGTETVDDLDGDGIGNWADLDDDGDTLEDTTEIGDDPTVPADQDGDGVPSFQDEDSDNDSIADIHELLVDPDQDGIPAYLDDDADGDCRPDSVEAGDSDYTTPPVDSDSDLTADFADIDSDNDGLSDTQEDPDCDGAAGGLETSAIDSDSDDDGVSDLVEVSAGTDPLDALDNPQAHGDFVFLVPYEGEPDPAEDDLDFSTKLRFLDVYVLIDRSFSMASEIDDVRDNLASAIENLTCPPLGSGSPGSCIPDMWSGAGTIGYTVDDPFENHLDLQPNPELTGPAVPTSSASGFTSKEPLMLATWSVATGLGSDEAGCDIDEDYGNRGTCDGSPAGSGAVGYPCFRPNALPVILFSTDEPIDSIDTVDCPGMSPTIAAVNTIGGKVIGIQGEGGGSSLRNEMKTLASQTGAIDALNGNEPLVFDGANDSQVSAIEDAVRALYNGVPLDISANPVDDAGDDVDAVASFVDHLETLQLGSPECTDGLTDQDTDGDGFPDVFLGVRNGTPVCWKVVPKPNTTVPAIGEAQLFRATVEVFGDSVTLLDSHDIYFLVPPDLSGPVVD